MMPRLPTDCGKNYCNRTFIVKVIVENVVTCIFMGHIVVVQCARCGVSSHRILWCLPEV